MRLRFLFVAAVVAALAGLPSGGALADSGSAQFEYHVGGSFLAGLNPAFDPVVARTSNGDTIELSGRGVLTVQPRFRSVNGGGTFTHKDAAGNALGRGTWTATRLLSFKSFGPSPEPGFPSTFTAGEARMDIQLFPENGGRGFDAVLRVTCLLPGVKAPGGAAEGIKVNVQDVANFNKEVSGATLFVLISQ